MKNLTFKGKGLIIINICYCKVHKIKRGQIFVIYITGAINAITQISMYQTTTQTNHQEFINFNFKTNYMGSEITLTVVSNNDRYSVLVDDKVIGHIKLGNVRHTWFVVDSKYIEPYLVDEIGNRIEAKYLIH